MSNNLIKIIISAIEETDESWYIPLTFTAEADSKIKLTKLGNPTVSGLQYRRGTSGEWNTYTISTALSVSAGESIQFQNTEERLSNGQTNYVQFAIEGGKMKASGNIQSMLNYSKEASYGCFYNLFKFCSLLTQAPELRATILNDYCYYSMFNGCYQISTAPELPAKTMAQYCYQLMFSGCRGFRTAPELPATTLSQGCYANMFYGCSNLTQLPELPATTLASMCYSAMFADCTGIITPMKQLPATTLATSCYSSMFSGCYMMTTAPELPATTLDYNCYESMFRNCTRLAQAPELPATMTQEYCYSYMFYRCTSLTQAPYLPALGISQGAYYHMFEGCSSLSYVEVNLIQWADQREGTTDWLLDVAEWGTFTAPSNLALQFGPSAIPNGWDIVGPQGIVAEDQTLFATVGQNIDYALNIITYPQNFYLEIISGSLPEGLTLTSDNRIQGVLNEPISTSVGIRITVEGIWIDKDITLYINSIASKAYDPVFYFPCINENIVSCSGNTDPNYPLYFTQLDPNSPITFGVDEEGVNYMQLYTDESYNATRTLQAQNLEYNNFFQYNYSGSWSIFYKLKLNEYFSYGNRNILALGTNANGMAIRIGLKYDEDGGFTYPCVDNYNCGDTDSYLQGDNSSRAINTNQWYDIVVTYNAENNGEYKFYMNGNLLTISYCYSTLYITNDNFYIGAYTMDYNWNTSVASQLSDITFWDKCLTDEEVQSL